jgi:hypothetical protein
VSSILSQLKVILTRGKGAQAFGFDDVNELIAEFDEDGDGMLDVEEFANAWGELDEEEVDKLRSQLMTAINKPVRWHSGRTC